MGEAGVWVGFGNYLKICLLWGEFLFWAGKPDKRRI